jgi:hypothetical protein
MGTPRYPRTVADDIREMRSALSGVQTAGQSRAPYDQASQGLWFPDVPADPPAPASGVRLYAKGGHLFAREADGTISQLTT